MHAKDYKQNVILAASPMELIMMLYNEAIKALSAALAGFETESPDRIQHVSNNLIHAQDVITELAVSLDTEKGGEIAQNLHRLYDFMLNHLAQANSAKNAKPIRDVKDLMCELRESWKEVAEKEPIRQATVPGHQTGNILISG